MMLRLRRSHRTGGRSPAKVLAPGAAAPERAARRGLLGWLHSRRHLLQRLFSMIAIAMAAQCVSAEEEKVGEASMDISVMLFAAIVMMMTLFYLVNSSDDEFAEYSWNVISSTISIFSAVLLFSGVNGVVEYYFLEEASLWFKIVVGFIHMLIWWAILQFLLAVITGAINPFGSKVKEMETLSKEEKFSMELKLKCWAVLLGHITGFAAIGAFGEVQQAFGKDDPVFAWAMGFIAYGVLFCLQLIMDTVREKIAKLDDGQEDEREKLWDEETEETEDDIAGLCCSFMFTQALRFQITGALPNVEGEEAEGTSHTTSQCTLLFSLGLLVLAIDLVRTLKLPSNGRITAQFRNIVFMVFSWCIYFTTDWAVKMKLTFGAPMLIQVVIACTVSGVAFIMIFFLDKLADLDFTGAEVDQMLREAVGSLAILIGFGWEKTFDMGVVQITEYESMFKPTCLTKLVLGMCLCALVIPAWRGYILVTILKYEEEKKEKEEEEKKERGEVSKEIEPLKTPLLGGESPQAEEKLKPPYQDKKLLVLGTAELKQELQKAKSERDTLKMKIARNDLQRIDHDAIFEKHKSLTAAMEEFDKEVTELQNIATNLTGA